jgi:hypothetical protein
MHIKNKRGQSTVEYILLVTAVVAVIIAFESGNGSGTFKNTLSDTLNSATQDISSMQDRLTQGHAETNSTDAGTPSLSQNVSW